MYRRLIEKFESDKQHLEKNPPQGLTSKRDFCRGLEMLLAEIKWYLRLKRRQRYKQNRKEKE